MSAHVFSRRRLLLSVLVLGWLSFSAGFLRAAEPAAPTAVRPRIVILGDSITAGYGVDPGESYPALLQQKIDAAKLPYQVVNAGVSGDTTSGGVRRVDWVLRQPVSVLVLALGGNDGLRGIAPSVTKSNLLLILERTRSRYPQAQLVVAGMQMPPNMGEEYTAEFRSIFPAVARERRATLIPFLLEGVGGKPEMNQPDLIHPTPAGHQRIAETVWESLRPLLRSSPSPSPSP